MGMIGSLLAMSCGTALCLDERYCSPIVGEPHFGAAVVVLS